MSNQDNIAALMNRIKLLEQELAEQEANKAKRGRRSNSKPKNWFGVYAPEIEREFNPEEHAKFVARHKDEHSKESGYVLGLVARCHNLSTQLKKR